MFEQEKGIINSQEHLTLFKEGFNGKKFELELIFRASEHDFSLEKCYEACHN